MIQNTPYIGHPAYKAMGARAGYTLADRAGRSASARRSGCSRSLVAVLPEAAVAPILIFIGLEITAQAFLASPPRHGAAVALTFVPVAAAVVLIELGGILARLGRSPADLDRRGGGPLPDPAGARQRLHPHRAPVGLGPGVDHRPTRGARPRLVFAMASLATLFGLIHSPLPSGAVFWPWAAGAPLAAMLPLAGAYGAPGRDDPVGGGAWSDR